MPKKERPLSRPQGTPFSGKKRFAEDNKGRPALADKIAHAAARGKLEELFDNEIPDNEHARKLLGMMMGMTGLQFPGHGSAGSPKEQNDRDGKAPEAEPSDRSSSLPDVPEDIIEAAKSGDMGDLVGLLRKEHEKRHPSGADDAPQERSHPEDEGLSSEEKDIINRIIRIASENNVSVDWVVLRALTLYVRDHKETGRL